MSAKTPGWAVSEWGRVYRELRTLEAWHLAHIERHGGLWEHWFLDEAKAQRQAVKNAEAMLAKVTAYRDAAKQRLEELG